MNRKLFLLVAVIALGLLAVLAAFNLSSPVAAQSAGEVWNSSAEAPRGTPLDRYSPADDPRAAMLQDDALTPEGIISWRVIGSALKPREDDVSYTVNSSGGCSYVTAGDAFTVWNTPIGLPNGSHIETLRMYFDDSSDSNSSAWFTIYDLYGQIVEEFGVTSTGNSGNSFNDSALIDHTVDYSTYAYLINWRPVVSGATMQLCGFRIFYDPPFLGFDFLPFYGNDEP